MPAHSNMTQVIPAEIIGKLREAIVAAGKSQIYKEVVEPRDEVLARFQPMFTPDNVLKITEEEFKSFLLFENNRHWTGLHRQGSRICSDMNALRKALSILVDEKRSVAKRLNEVDGRIKGMGKNIITAILLLTYPDNYGVWNNRSEANLKRLGIWPMFERGESFGNRYEKVNTILLHLRDALGTDLWTLDALWWYLDQSESIVLSDEEDNISLLAQSKGQRFGLERHLHEFLRDNWDATELGKEWMIHQEPGDEEAGYEYPCDVGRIDLLARHRTDKKWLVVELKRNQTSDQTIGQALRYIGWVKQHLAEEGDEVSGLIICRDVDAALHYALSVVPDIELKFYEVEFHLRNP